MVFKGGMIYRHSFASIVDRFTGVPWRRGEQLSNCCLFMVTPSCVTEKWAKYLRLTLGTEHFIDVPSRQE